MLPSLAATKRELCAKRRELLRYMLCISCTRVCFSACVDALALVWDQIEWQEREGKARAKFEQRYTKQSAASSGAHDAQVRSRVKPRMRKSENVH